MKSHVSAILLGVTDVERAKSFYSEGLGWSIEQDHGQFVSFKPGEGSSPVALYERGALADDAGVPAEGDGFTGITFSYIVSARERVDEVLAEAEKAGGGIPKPAQAGSWGGYFGYFSDPDGYLWKVAFGDGDEPHAAE